MRPIDADALMEKCGDWYVEEGTESGFIGTLKNLLATEPTIQPQSTTGQLNDGARSTAQSTDLIDRGQAIDALDVLCQEHRYRIPGKRETYSEYNEAWQDALDRAEGLIFNLPPVQPEPQWIPVSERLPEKGGEYLVSVHHTIGAISVFHQKKYIRGRCGNYEILR